MSESSIGAALSSAIAWRRDYFKQSLAKTIKDPTCEHTHDLSTSLRRLLVVDGAMQKLYGAGLIPAKKMVAVKKFRKVLNAIRDNHELLQKLRNLELTSECFLAVIGVLEKSLSKLQKKIVKSCCVLKEQNIARYFSKKASMKILKKERCLAVSDLLHNLLAEVGVLYEEALTKGDDRALHKLRVKYKAFRYSFELLAPVLVETPEGTLEYLKSIQTELGEAHDWLVIEDTVDEIINQDGFGELEGEAELRVLISEQHQQSNTKAREYLQQEWGQICELAAIIE